MLKPGGYFIWTCATTGRPVHGTKSQDEIDKKITELPKAIVWKGGKRCQTFREQIGTTSIIKT